MSKEALLAVLKRYVEDIIFFGQLSEDCVKTLQDYELTREELVAIATGDVRWIEAYIGRKVDERLVTKGLIPLLSKERW